MRDEDAGLIRLPGAQQRPFEPASGTARTSVTLVLLHECAERGTAIGLSFTQHQVLDAIAAWPPPCSGGSCLFSDFVLPRTPDHQHVLTGTRSRCVAAFSTGFDAVEHPPLHDETDRPDHMPEQPWATRVAVALPGSRLPRCAGWPGITAGPDRHFCLDPAAGKPWHRVQEPRPDVTIVPGRQAGRGKACQWGCHAFR